MGVGAYVRVTCLFEIRDTRGVSGSVCTCGLSIFASVCLSVCVPSIYTVY